MKKPGIREFIYILGKRIYLRILSVIFGFDPWHSKMFYENSGYTKDVVELCNELDVNMVIELGCGLGEQLVRIEKDNRIGIDIDKNVIKAAKFKNTGNTNFFSCNILAPNDYKQLLQAIPDIQKKSRPFSLW